MKLVIWMQSSRKYSERATGDQFFQLQDPHLLSGIKLFGASELPAQVRTLDREGASKHLDERAVEEVLPEHGGVDGGRHQHHSHLGVGLDHVPEDHHEEVRLQKEKHDSDPFGFSGQVLMGELTLRSLSWISSTMTWLMPLIPASSFLRRTPETHFGR